MRHEKCQGRRVWRIKDQTFREKKEIKNNEGGDDQESIKTHSLSQLKKRAEYCNTEGLKIKSKTCSMYICSDRIKQGFKRQT